MLRITSLKGAVDRLVADGRQPEGAALRTVARKSDHLRINLQEDVAAKGVSSGFDRYRFLHRALPEIDLDAVQTRVTILGRDLRAPILISCMTGGTPEAERINTTLAQVAQEQGLAIGLGSGRVLLENPEVLSTFDVRRHAPDVPLFANLGAVQLNKGMTVDDARRLVELVGADALVLHLNPLQEALQPHGDTCFADLLPRIAALCRGLGKPVVVKEVGWGLAPDVVRDLVEAGAAGVDVAGAGGTSWSEVERHRLVEPWRARAAAAFAGWGLPTADALRQARAAAPDALVFASGGIRDGLDVAKAVALGADLAGVAGPFLRAADDGFETARDLALELSETLRIAMFCIGTRSLAELRATPRMVEVGGSEPRFHTETLTVVTEAAGRFWDLTDDVQRVVTASGVLQGQVHVYSHHTTAAIRINENEPLLLEDFRRLLERLAPVGGYEHDDLARRRDVPPDEPLNGHAHSRHLLLSTSETLPVTGGRLDLGTWQSIFLVELCSPRVRRVTVQVMGR